MPNASAETPETDTDTVATTREPDDGWRDDDDEAPEDDVPDDSTAEAALPEAGPPEAPGDGDAGDVDGAAGDAGDAEPDPVADRAAALDQLTREAEDMDLYDDPPAPPPADVPPAPDALNVVVFDKVGNVTIGAINEAQTGIDWTVSNATTDDDIPVLFNATVYGVYNLVTGEAKLHGPTVSAHAREWAALVASLPEVPPLHPDPFEFYRAKLAADEAAKAAEPEAVPQPIDAELAAAVDVTADAPTEAPADAPVVVEPEAAPLAPEQHAAIANAHWGAMHARGVVTFDVAATAQGAAIAADAARERRQQFPASIPEASVAAVESLGGTLRNLRHLVACYRHLTHAAAGGVDVSEALAAVDEVAAPLFPELG